MNDVLWQAPGARRRASLMWQFAERTAALHGAAPDDYAALHAWSLREPGSFYSALWDFADIVGDTGERTLSPGARLRDTRFFPDARLNYAENLLRNPDDSEAFVTHYENGARRSISRAQLYELVSRYVQALQAEGVVAGDRVAAIVTHDVEALAAYLATAALGAVWSSCSPDFGPVAASERLCQIAPKVLLAVTHYDYGGKRFDVTPTLAAVAQGAGIQDSAVMGTGQDSAVQRAGLARVVLIGAAIPPALDAFRCVTLDDWLAPFTPTTIPFARLPFSTPLAILYSSGTTGKPKCIVHSAGGLLLQHKKELLLHCDLRAGERFFYYTTCGWMMWNWHVSGLACGATLVSADGNPMHPAQSRLLDVCDAEDLHVFGTSARYIGACAGFDLKPRETHALHSLRLVLSTGSPLLPQGFDYVYSEWKQDLQLASISGGTDICGCFVGGNPLLPVRRGEIQCALLGMDVDVLDDDGRPLVGKPGELVCRNAHPSMPVGFLGDESGERYDAAYFTRFPGIWTQGDFAEACASGGFIIHGRSDATLNPGGVRIGTAEIYRQLQDIPAIDEALAVGHDIDGDQRVVLFVKLRDGHVLAASLIQDIRTAIRKGASPRHVPASIHAVSDFPRTRSGKLCESAVRAVINGREVKQLNALANPEALIQFRVE
ncbi:MAG TPA: acetoacetate--CoA ligase [Pseudomonadales bacterium]